LEIHSRPIPVNFEKRLLKIDCLYVKITIHAKGDQKFKHLGGLVFEPFFCSKLGTESLWAIARVSVKTQWFRSEAQPKVVIKSRSLLSESPDIGLHNSHLDES
jgi:hypothetical protein